MTRLCLIVLICLLNRYAAAEATTLSLTVDQARRQALAHNRQYLAALEDVAKANAQIATARSGVFPDLSFDAGYLHTFEVPSFFIFSDSETVELKTGSKHGFNASLALTQSLWEGGKALNAWAIAKLYRKYSEAGRARVEAEVSFTAEALFYEALKTGAELELLRQALEANTENLATVQKRHSQGMVSDFELLRAEVERNNLLPGILAAESEVRLSRKRLQSFLGLNLNDSLLLVEEQHDTLLANLPPKETIVAQALESRPETRQSEYLTQITHKAIHVALGDYQPALRGMVRYDWTAQSDQFRLDRNTSSSWTAGLTLNIPIWKGGRVGGDVAYRRADHNQVKLVGEQLRDDITLEVEQAYDQLLQAKESLTLQGTNIARAQEGLRIANLRYSQGIGTQLEVLSAQTALTDARRARVVALNNFRQARAALKKATTVDITAKAQS